MTLRKTVFHALDTERDYQDDKWGSTESKGLHSITEFLAYMNDYVQEALHIEAREGVQTADPQALNIVRKIASLGVACMEQHGAPIRNGW